MWAWKVPTDFVPYRRGIIEHLISGKMMWHEFAVYSLLLLLANEQTGMVEKTNAVLISEYFRNKYFALSRWQIDTLLGNLEDKKYIKRFYGSRKNNYHILINKYYISGFGWVDAGNSTSWDNVKIVPVTEIIETNNLLPAPRVWAPQKWSIEIADFYNQKIRPCHAPAIAKLIEKIECEIPLLKKCTENYGRYVEFHKKPMEYRMKAVNFYHTFEFLTYQDANMDKLIQTTDNVFERLLKESQNERLKEQQGIAGY